MSLTLQMVTDATAALVARSLTSVRADMAPDFEAEGCAVPRGPKWLLSDGDRILGMGGLEPRGAAASAGWLLVGDDLTPRDWANGRRAMRAAMDFARSRCVRRVGALVDPDRKAPQEFLARMGFVPAEHEEEGLMMALELNR